jgi:hypothetical protein
MIMHTIMHNIYKYFPENLKFERSHFTFRQIPYAFQHLFAHTFKHEKKKKKGSAGSLYSNVTAQKQKP